MGFSADTTLEWQVSERDMDHITDELGKSGLVLLRDMKMLGGVNWKLIDPMSNVSLQSWPKTDTELGLKPQGPQVLRAFK